MSETKPHPLAWLLWLVAADVAVLITRNPLYLLLLGLEFSIMKKSVSSEHEPTEALSLILGTVALAATFNALLAHTGGSVLFHLPEAIPLLGGAITLEALLYGAINGLGLTVLFTAFTVFNRVITLRELLRFIPRTLTPLAIVISIAMTYVPATQRQFQLIREAQAIRGHRVRGWRDWRPLLMPLLIGGLERSLHLAEALAARGLVGEGSSLARHRSTQYHILVGLGLLLGGTWLKLTTSGGNEVLLIAILFFLWLLWRGSNRIPRTSYDRHPWQRKDTLIVLGAWLPIFMLILRDVSYTPYPVLCWPPFVPEVGISLLGFLVPLGMGTS